ncbi:MAG: hypothetical protein AAF125_12325 [Chloroflexota bacterium]
MWRDYKPGCAQILAGGFVLVILIVALIAGLTSGARSGPSYIPVTGDRLANYDFETDLNGWIPSDNFEHNANGGALRGSAAPRDGYAFTHQREEFRGVVIEANITLATTTERTSAATGIVCNARPDGSGYYFLLSSAGSARIARVSVEGEFIPLTEWTDNDIIRPVAAGNRLRAVCSQGYLGLFVNDLFVVQAEDTTRSRGLVGAALAANVADDAPDFPRVTVDWGNVVVYEVQALSIR